MSDIVERQPEYVPAHKLPVWLSSADVEATIKAVVNKRGVTAKATGWDILAAITELANKQRAALSTEQTQ